MGANPGQGRAHSDTLVKDLDLAAPTAEGAATGGMTYVGHAPHHSTVPSPHQDFLLVSASSSRTTRFECVSPLQAWSFISHPTEQSTTISGLMS